MLVARALALLLALGCTGCIHHLGGAKKPAHGWDKQPADCATLRDPCPKRATLRIFACHSKWYGDHAAIWVGSPSGLWAFWDPAGWYADEKCIPDKEDVICRPFDLERYWRWRHLTHDGLDMLVFEWDVSEREARRVHRLLTSGCYPTLTWAGLCCVAVCEFISRHIPYVNSPPPPFSIFPGMLGELLWSQKPDRVIVFHKDCPTQIWTPQAGPRRRRLPTPLASCDAPAAPQMASAAPAPGSLLRAEDIRPAGMR